MAETAFITSFDTEATHLWGEPTPVKLVRDSRWQALGPAASIAHDMRGPLATITTSAELLEQELGTDEGSNLVAIIQRQAFRLQQMIQDLADYLSLPNKGIQLCSEKVDVVELVREVCTEVQRFTTSHSLTLELPAAAVRARVDAGKVRRILQNLLGNAIKYSPTGGSVLIRLRPAGQSGGSLLLEVEDEGPGIPAGLRNSAFEPLVRLDPSQGTGQGLGLYIVRCLAEAHGGLAWAEEAPGGGARLCVSLPTTK